MASSPFFGRIPTDAGPWPGLGGLRYLARASDDVDRHASHLSCWSQEYDQLSQGRFAGRVRELWAEAPRLQVFHEHTRQQTSQHCLPWHGSVWFGIPDGRAADAVHFCGRRQAGEAARPLLRAAADASFTLRTPEDFGIYGVVVDEAWLAARLDTLRIATGRGAPALQSQAMAPARHAALCETIEQMLKLAATGEAGQGWGQVAVQMLVDHLLRLLCAEGDGAGRDAAALAEQAASRRRLALVMAARELVSRPMNHTMTVDGLCSELHVTRRTLQNHFHSVVGESPADFLKAVRLNACRRRLRSGGTTVQDVAAQWGFFHMGHFARDYRAMFGELPSQTLRGGPAAGH